jgi:hypothetical protein
MNGLVKSQQGGAGSPCDGLFKLCAKGLKCGTKNKQTVCVAK